MNFNLPVLLLDLILICGLICLFDRWLWAPQRREAQNKELPWAVDYARSFFPVLLIVLVVRSFIFQPFEVPTGSLSPTVMPGDFLFVNQFAYGLRLPVWGTKILDIGTPQRGDVAVFNWPVNPNVDFVKRVIGVPGDVISYDKTTKQLTVNGKPLSQKDMNISGLVDPDNGNPVSKRVETLLNGNHHDIYINPTRNIDGFQNIVVPKNSYFMMGDNRDNSGDSRYWGFVPANYFVGKAEFIAFSLNPAPVSIFDKIRWGRIGDRMSF